MAFKTAFIVRAPGADPAVDFSTIKTNTIEATTVAVDLGNADQMVSVCETLAKQQGIHVIVLCPAVSNEMVVAIQKAIGDGVALFVARGDFTSMNVVQEITDREWFSAQPEE